MRNTILVIVAVASITFAAPAFAVSQCSNNVCLDDKPISDLFDTSPSPSLYRTMNESSEQVPAGHTRHTRNYHSGGYHHHG